MTGGNLNSRPEKQFEPRSTSRHPPRIMAAPHARSVRSRLLRGVHGRGILAEGWERVPPATRFGGAAETMAEGRSGCSDSPGRARRHRRGFVTLQLPRHVRIKRLKSGATSFYYEVPTKYRNMKCPVPSEPLGSDFALAREKADTLNACSTNGTGSVRDNRSRHRQRRRSGPSIGYSANTSRAWPTPRKSPSARDETTNGP